jgi:hypothetical protein
MRSFSIFSMDFYYGIRQTLFEKKHKGIRICGLFFQIAQTAFDEINARRGRFDRDKKKLRVGKAKIYGNHQA